jgi:hypothetical protein
MQLCSRLEGNHPLHLRLDSSFQTLRSCSKFSCSLLYAIEQHFFSGPIPHLQANPPDLMLECGGIWWRCKVQWSSTLCLKLCRARESSQFQFNSSSASGSTWFKACQMRHLMTV